MSTQDKREQALREAFSQHGKRTASRARVELDHHVNKESLNMINRMLEHRKITLEDNYPEDHELSLNDIVDIDVAFLIQEIAGLKVLLRNDLEKKKGEIEIEVEDAAPVIDNTGAEA